MFAVDPWPWTRAKGTRQPRGASALEAPPQTTSLTGSLKIYLFRLRAVNENHPVLSALQRRLGDLQETYRHQPNERTRYQVVRTEQLIAQWAPGVFNAA